MYELKNNEQFVEMPNLDYTGAETLLQLYKELGWNPAHSVVNTTKVKFNTNDLSDIVKKMMNAVESEEQKCAINQLMCINGPSCSDDIPHNKVVLSLDWLTMDEPIFVKNFPDVETEIKEALFALDNGDQDNIVIKQVTSEAMNHSEKIESLCKYIGVLKDTEVGLSGCTKDTDEDTFSQALQNFLDVCNTDIDVIMINNGIFERISAIMSVYLYKTHTNNIKLRVGLA